MMEVRWHGRRGTGFFRAAKLLGYASTVYENQFAQAVPYSDGIQMGMPTFGFTRIFGEAPIDHSGTCACGCIVVFDETICDVVDTTEGLDENGYYIINTKRTTEELRGMDGFKGVKNLIAFDATKIAMETLGMPIVYMILLGVIARVTHMVSLVSLEHAMDDTMAKHIAEKNKLALRYAYDLAQECI